MSAPAEGKGRLREQGEAKARRARLRPQAAADESNCRTSADADGGRAKRPSARDSHGPTAIAVASAHECEGPR